MLSVVLQAIKTWLL